MNVSVDPITDAADRAKRGYRCDAKAATRDGEPARPRYAFRSSLTVERRGGCFVRTATAPGRLLGRHR